MTVLFDGPIDVHYGFVLLTWGDDEQPELLSARGGQVNGLCGAASPGCLSMITGLHTGEVPVTVEVLPTGPGLDARWEEVVEVSCTPTSTRWSLSAFDAWHELSAPGRPGPMRARWSARGMEAARLADVRSPGEPELDRYLLQLWPDAEARPDEVLRATSEIAGYWHGVALVTAPPPPPPPPPDPAQVAAVEREADRRALAQHEALLLATVWGGVVPSDRVRDLGGSTPQVFRVDPGLVEELAVLPGGQQRQVAVEVARAACRRAGLDDVDHVRAALDAAGRGGPLPPPFDDRRAALDFVLDPDGTSTSVVATVAWWGRQAPPRTVLDPAVAAVCALVSAGQADPLLAAVDALADAMAAHEDEGAYLATVRSTLPGPSSGPDGGRGTPPAIAPG